MKKSYKLSAYSIFTLLVTLLIGCSQHEPNYDPPEMWGQLEQGPYSIGFKTLFNHDASRPSIPYSDWDGKQVPTSETSGRQMQINIWYPAEVTGNSRRLNFGYYVDLFGRQIEFSDLDKVELLLLTRK